MSVTAPYINTKRFFERISLHRLSSFQLTILRRHAVATLRLTTFTMTHRPLYRESATFISTPIPTPTLLSIPFPSDQTLSYSQRNPFPGIATCTPKKNNVKCRTSAVYAVQIKATISKGTTCTNMDLDSDSDPDPDYIQQFASRESQARSGW